MRRLRVNAKWVAVSTLSVNRRLARTRRIEPFEVSTQHFTCEKKETEFCVEVGHLTSLKGSYGGSSRNKSPKPVNLPNIYVNMGLKMPLHDKRGNFIDSF